MRNLYGPCRSPYFCHRCSKDLVFTDMIRGHARTHYIVTQGTLFSLSSFCPVFHIWSLVFHIQLKSSSAAIAHLSPEENLNRPPSPQSFTRIFSLPPSHDEGWTQQLTFQFVFRSDPQCSSPDRHAELLITSVLTLAIFGFDFQVQISIFFKSFIWKNEVLPLRKEELQDCAYSSFTTRSHTKKEKKSLYQLE